MRMDDLARLPLGAFTVQHFNDTRPYSQRVLVLGVHYGKTNQDNSKTDLRAIGPSKYVHSDPLVSASLLTMMRLFLFDGRPLPMAVIRNSTLCAPSPSRCGSLPLRYLLKRPGVCAGKACHGTVRTPALPCHRFLLRPGQCCLF
jgi:hypothetical protein